MDTNTTSRRRFLAGMVGTGLGVLSHTAVFGKNEKNQTEPPPEEKGFVRLFNGQDLQGWHKNKQKIVHGLGGSWKVEQGASRESRTRPAGKRRSSADRQGVRRF